MAGKTVEVKDKPNHVGKITPKNPASKHDSANNHAKPTVK
jgi:hypothetical protein